MKIALAQVVLSFKLTRKYLDEIIIIKHNYGALSQKYEYHDGTTYNMNMSSRYLIFNIPI